MTTPLLFSEEVQVPYDDVPSSEEMLRTSTIPWDIYMTARLISDQDLQYLRRYDKRDNEVRDRLLTEAGPLYVTAFLSVLKNVSKDETVQYVLALLDDMLAGNSQRAQLFYMLNEVNGVPSPGPDPYAILLRLLDRNDWFTQEKAALLLAAILGSRPSSTDSTTPLTQIIDTKFEATVSVFLEWLMGQLRRPGHHSRGIPTAVHALSVLLRDPSIRVTFYSSGSTPLLAPLVTMPSNGTQLNIQLLYEAALCVWQLSYYKPAAETLASTGVVGGLVDIVRLAQKEKLVRISLLALRNLLSEGAAPALEYAVIAKGLPKAVSNRMLQNWDDEDLPPLLEWMQAHLEQGVLSLSSINRYRREVMSGSLTWSPLHEQEGFWLENGEHLVENNCQLLKALLHLLESSNDPVTLAVACNDIAQFVTYYPHGRGLVSELGGKSMVMRLMAHPSGDVQAQALKCVQRLLLSKTSVEYLQAETS